MSSSATKVALLGRYALPAEWHMIKDLRSSANQLLNVFFIISNSYSFFIKMSSFHDFFGKNTDLDHLLDPAQDVLW
jgi:hypothetical protein